MFVQATVEPHTSLQASPTQATSSETKNRKTKS